MRPVTTFTKAIKVFLNESTWLTPIHQPAIISLISMAKELDNQNAEGKLMPPLLAQFGLAYRNLLKEKPTNEEANDELTEALLKGRNN